MHDIEIIAQNVIERFPQATIEIDKPKMETGNWWLDIRFGDKMIVVEQRSSNFFGVSVISENDDVGFGDGPDEVCEDVDSVKKRVVEILEQV